MLFDGKSNDGFLEAVPQLLELGVMVEFCEEFLLADLPLLSQLSRTLVRSHGSRVVSLAARAATLGRLVNFIAIEHPSVFKGDLLGNDFKLRVEI